MDLETKLAMKFTTRKIDVDFTMVRLKMSENRQIPSASHFIIRSCQNDIIVRSILGCGNFYGERSHKVDH